MNAMIECRAETAPDVSVIIACYNAADFLRSSVRSALDQRGVAVEVIIVDDCSTDDSLAIANELATADPRVRVDRLTANEGPGGARNRGMDLARGSWIAVLDSDDLYHPDRLGKLIAEADMQGADLIADDLLIFDDGDHTPPTGFFAQPRDRRPGWIGLHDYLRETVMYGAMPNLGFLKPLLRRSFVDRHGIRYDQRLRIAEDDDLILQALAAGGRYRTVPMPTYMYRKHGSSISHRLSLANVEAMLGAADRRTASLGKLTDGERRAWNARSQALRNTRDFTLAIEAIKARRIAGVAGLMLKRPGLIPLFRMPLAAKLQRWFGKAPAITAPAVRQQVSIISRQRLIGATNGSSTYLIDLARTVRAAGMEPHLIQPSPLIFGRIPVFKLKPEMAVFQSHHLRGALRIGDWFVATDPRIYGHAALGVVARLGRKMGLPGNWTVDRPAPYAVTAPWAKPDLLYVTRHVRPRAGRVIADYAFQTEAFPYIARPGVPTAIVMHDLFHARADRFAASGHRDSVATISRDEECALLGRADVVLAIQQQEAAFVAESVPGTRALTVPMAVSSIDAASPGTDGTLLFVGSNTAPNVTALEWFFAETWPRIRSTAPHTRLDIAGTVFRGFAGDVPEGVRFLGLVDDLAAAYAQAGVVISPLIHGSGLKIKLVEALAHGKAVVATSVTVEGVEAETSGAVIRTDDPAEFAEAIIELVDDVEARLALAERALDCARRHFSAEACHAGFREWLRG